MADGIRYVAPAVGVGTGARGVVRLAGIAVIVVLLSGGCETGAADPKAAVRSIVERGWNRGEVDTFSRTLADTVDFHYAGSAREMSRDQMSAIVLRWREAFPDLRMELEEMISEGDLVAARLTLSGTHEGPWGGGPPPGR